MQSRAPRIKVIRCISQRTKEFPLITFTNEQLQNDVLEVTKDYYKFSVFWVLSINQGK